MHRSIALSSHSLYPPTLQALELFQRIGEVAEAEGHHPDLHLVVSFGGRGCTNGERGRGAACLVHLPALTSPGPQPQPNACYTRPLPVDPPHPRPLAQGYNTVAVELWTHARSGLSENDFIMAAKIDALPLGDLLSKKPPPPEEEE